MIYITGENDTIESIKREREIEGSLAEFSQDFYILNPQISKSPTQKIPPYTPVLIPGLFDSRDTNRFRENASELKNLSPSQRTILRGIQEDRQDIITQIALQYLMSDMGKYADDFVQEYNSPLITTPWSPINNSLTRGNLLDILVGTSTFASRGIGQSIPLRRFDALYDHMVKRDILNRELYNLPKNGNGALQATRRALQQQIQKHTDEIKLLLPKRLETFIEKLMFRGFTQEELMKMRRNSFSQKMARKGKYVTTNFEFLSRTGLEHLKKWIERLEKFSKYGKVVAKYTGPAVVAYESGRALIPNRGEQGAQWDRALGTALKGGAGLAAGWGFGTLAGGSTSAVGAAVLSGFAADATLGSTLLICSPLLGWVVCGAIGLVAVGYVSYKASEFVGYLWEHKQEIWDEAKTIYHSVEEKVASIWESSREMFHHFYDSHALGAPGIAGR